MEVAATDPFEGMDPKLRRQLAQWAATLVRGLLDQLGEFRPRQRPARVRYQRGYAQFAHLYQFASREMLLILFNEALAAIPVPDRRFSVSDPALCLTTDDEFTVMIHPPHLNVSALSEVPDSVRIFGLRMMPPHEISELVPYSAARIRENRDYLAKPLTISRQQWREVQQPVARDLIDRLRHALARARLAGQIDPEVLSAVDELLNKALATRGPRFNELLEAAHHLGMLEEVVASFKA